MRRAGVRSLKDLRAVGAATIDGLVLGAEQQTRLLNGLQDLGHTDLEIGQIRERERERGVKSKREEE